MTFVAFDELIGITETSDFSSKDKPNELDYSAVTIDIFVPTDSVQVVHSISPLLDLQHFYAQYLQQELLIKESM